MDNTGWVKVNRSLQQNDLWHLEKFTKGQAWVDLIMLANHKEGIMAVRGNIIKIERGQVGWSEVNLARKWKWSRDKFRRFIKYLKNVGQIRQQKNFITSIMTIVNYERFQGNDTTDNTANKQQKDSKQYTNKNNKKKKNDKKNIYEIFINKFNSLRGTKYTMNQEVIKLYEFWNKTFTDEQILKAVENIPKHSWLKTIEYTPTIFLRTNKDWIDQCLNLKGQFKKEKTIQQLAEDEYYQQRGGNFLTLPQIIERIKNEQRS